MIHRNDLVGYDDAVVETARLTESRPALDEQEQKELDMRLRGLADHLKKQPVVRIRYFVPDERKMEVRLLRFPGKLIEYPTQMQLSF